MNNIFFLSWWTYHQYVQSLYWVHYFMIALHSNTNTNLLYHFLCSFYAPPITIYNVVFNYYYYFFFGRFGCIWILFAWHSKWGVFFVSKNICSTCANNCMPGAYTFLNRVITPLSFEFWGKDTPSQAWRLCLVEWNGREEKRKEKEKGEEKEWRMKVLPYCVCVWI